MAAVIAKVTGTALTPGVSRNGRLYTREAIAKAVARGQARIADGKRPISMRSHHGAGDDSTHIVGHVTRLWQDSDSGAAKYEGVVADTAHGRDIASLTDDTDGQPQHLRGVSIRGAWMEDPRTETIDGREVSTADDLEIAGLDYTAEPGVDDADVHHLAPGSDEDAPCARFAITESVADATVAPPLAEAKTALSKRGSGLTGTGGPYADPGYLADKKQRYQLDTKARAKAAWSYINQKDNAAQYTANQLKRIKQRIVKALKGFGVEVNTAEHYLIDRLGVITESAALAEHYLDGDSEYGATAGSFCISLANGPVNITISSYRVDPADLDLIGRAAMDGACKALATLDPDMDGDMDVPGADAEDTDRDTPDANLPGAACPCGCGCAVPLEPGECPCGCVCAVCGDGEEPMGEEAPPAVETAPDPAAPAADPAPQAAADPTTETEEPAVSEPTTAVEPTQAAPAPAPAPGTFTFEQVQALLAAAQRPVEAAAAAPLAETTPPPAPAAVAETQEQMIQRLVREGITAGIQAAVATGGITPSRKGLVGRPVAESGAEPVLTEFGVPEDWPQKPLHKYNAQETRDYVDRQLGEHVLGNALYTGRRSG